MRRRYANAFQNFTDTGILIIAELRKVLIGIDTTILFSRFDCVYVSEVNAVVLYPLTDYILLTLDSLHQPIAARYALQIIGQIRRCPNTTQAFNCSPVSRVLW